MRRPGFFLLVMLVVATTAAAEERFRWKGRVDGTDEILVKGRSVRVNHIADKPIQRQDHRFSSRLPARDVEVELNVVEGRGKVRLMEQPSERNDYAVVVRIEDEQGGSGDYEFELVWDDDDDWDDDWDDDVRWNDDADGDDASGAFRWEGRVDIGARIEIRGNRHTVIDQGGQGVSERRARFESVLPERDVPVSVRKLEGRGDVELLQTPSEDNDYTAIVEIEDDKNGADDYEFELRWQRN
jgi:hypothetical protein